MAKGRPFTLVGLDIGTSKTAVIIAEAGGGAPKPVGAGVSPGLGVQNGVVTCPGATARSIRQALEQAGKTSEVEVAAVYTGYNGVGIAVRDCEMSSRLGGVSHRGGNGRGAGCTGAETAGIPENEKVLQLIPSRIIHERSGCCPGSGGRAITAPAGDLANIVESARLAGLAIQEIIYGPLACAQALLTPAERELGTLLVDIGAGTSAVSFFYRGVIRETAILPVGGEHLAGDLAIGLRISLALAVSVLKDYSSMTEAGETGKLTIPAGQEGEEYNQVSLSLIREIVNARITEILDLIALAVKNFDYPVRPPGGVVFSGGGSRLAGLVHLAGSRLQMPVRIAFPEITGPDLNPACVNALGLVKYGFTRLSLDGWNGISRGEQFASRFLNWLQDKMKSDSSHLGC